MYYQYMKGIARTTTYTQDSNAKEREAEEGDFLLELNSSHQ